MNLLIGTLKEKNDFYLFGSRIATHVIFWICYYVFYSLIWVTDKGYFASFYLEFVLLPIRIMAVYITIYALLPRLLLNRKYLGFIIGYVLILLAAGILQRVFIHLFYENLMLNAASEGLFSLKMLLRAVILINTTVFLVLGIKLFQIWVVAFEKTRENGREQNIVLRSNRRVHRVNFAEILFIEGLGNYVNYHLDDGSKITAYGSIKKALEALPEDFIRVHKSYIINRHKIKSYDAVSIQVINHSVPRGKGVSDEQLAPPPETFTK